MCNPQKNNSHLSPCNFMQQPSNFTCMESSRLFTVGFEDDWVIIQKDFVIFSTSCLVTPCCTLVSKEIFPTRPSQSLPVDWCGLPNLLTLLSSLFGGISFKILGLGIGYRWVGYPQPWPGHQQISFSLIFSSAARFACGEHNNGQTCGHNQPVEHQLSAFEGTIIYVRYWVSNPMEPETSFSKIVGSKGKCSAVSEACPKIKHIPSTESFALALDTIPDDRRLCLVVTWVKFDPYLQCIASFFT